MRVLLFDWEEGGHHEGYLERFATALASRADVTVAAPDSVLGSIADAPGDRIDLGPARPEKGGIRTRPRLDRRELELLKRAAAESRATHALHLFADPLLPILATQRELDSPLTLLLLRPRIHYPRLGTALSMRERAVGRVYEILLARFRHRRDATAVFTLDPIAARRWQGLPGAPAHWLPEPWIDVPPQQGGRTRDGCILYGYLSARKGVDRLAAAAEYLDAGSRVVIAGEAAPDFADELDLLCERMTASGARVERVGRIDERQAQELLASASVAVLPYRRHVGMSRVLFEAATAGTPAVVDDFGLLGHVTEAWELGAAVDTDQPRAFATAIERLDPAADDGAELRARAERLVGRTAFEAALAKVF